MEKHPLTKVDIHLFQRLDYDGTGIEFMARYFPYGTYPIYFQGDSKEETLFKARTWADEKAKANEEGYNKKLENMKKAREAKGKKLK